MGKALYRKYRSTMLSELVGQEHITSVLANSLKAEKVSHAYLFVGPRGTGKTSVARILAHEVNGFKYEVEDSYLDIIEIDAASNTGVDNIRDLREKAMIAPSVGKYKVYIIDEVHMLSKSAFNALLKTLEEPPEHVIFIMATTDAHKVPVTIVSRAQKFVFRLASEEVMTGYLRKVAEAEGIAIDDGALGVIARRSGGSFRDALSLLDQIAIMSEGEITAGVIEDALGLPAEEKVGRLLECFVGGDAGEIVEILRELARMGVRAELVAEELIGRIVREPKREYLGLLDKLTGVMGGGFAEVKLLLALVGGENVASQGSSSEDNDLDISSTIQPPAGGFSWAQVVEGVKRESAPLGAHLSKLQGEMVEDRLVIYAKTKFLKGIVDKGLKVIARQLPEGTVIEVVAGMKPDKDERVAKISAIMGGVEEVKVDG